MRRGGLVAALGLLALAGCKGPGAAFVGDWAGTYECRGQVRGTMEPYSEPAASQTIVIDETADGAIFIAGRGCTIWLSPLSDMQATPFLASPCVVTTSTGVPASTSITGGVVQRRGEILTYSMTWELRAYPDTADEIVIDTTCTFDGDRI